MHAGLCGCAIHTSNTCLVHKQRAACDIEVWHAEGNLLRWAQPGEESELVVVGLRFASVLADRGNQLLGLIDPEWIRPDPLLARHAAPTQPSHWVDVMRMVAVPEFKRAPQDAQRIVECLSAAVVCIRDARERHVVAPQEGPGTDPRTPECVQHASIA